MVLDSAGAPVAGVAVRANGFTPTRDVRQEWTRTSRNGTYGFCHLPPDERVLLTVTDRVLVRVRGVVELAPREFRWMELWAGR